MGNGRIEIKHIFPDETDYVIWTIRKTSNLLTLVPATFYDGFTTLTNQTKFVYAAPHPESVLVLTDIEPVMYLATAYRSVDGIALDEELGVQLAIDGSSGAQYSTETYMYIVDRGDSGSDLGEVWADPVSAQIEIRDERLLNQKYSVFERGTGELIPPLDYKGNPIAAKEYDDRSDAGGGFDLAVTDKVFNEDAIYFVTVHKRLSAGGFGAEGSDLGGEVAGVVFLTADIDFDPATMAGKLLYADFTTVVGVLTFPNLSLIPDCSFKVSTHDGTQRNLSLQLDAGDVVRFLGASRNVIHLGKGEEISLMVRDSVLYVLGYEGDYRRLGQKIGADKLELNSVFRNGAEYVQADFPRLMEYIDSLPGAQVVSYATWDASQLVDYVIHEDLTVVEQKTVYPNKGFFARDDIAMTFRVPDDRDILSKPMKFVDGTNDTTRVTQGPGGYQIDMFKGHPHKYIYRIGGSDDNEPGHTKSYMRDIAAPDGSGYGNGTITTKKTGGTITRPENRGELPILII